MYRLEDGRILRSGLCVGSSDLIGVTTIQITQDMVGSLIGVFVACEVKDKTEASDDQLRFLKAIKDAGGIALLSNSVESFEQQFEDQLNGYYRLPGSCGQTLEPSKDTTTSVVPKRKIKRKGVRDRRPARQQRNITFD